MSQFSIGGVKIALCPRPIACWCKHIVGFVACQGSEVYVVCNIRNRNRRALSAAVYTDEKPGEESEDPRTPSSLTHAQTSD